MKGWSPFTKLDDNLKDVDISGMSFEGLNEMRSQISKDKDPNDYKKISRAMLDKRNKVFETDPKLAKTMKI